MVSSLKWESTTKRGLRSVHELEALLSTPLLSTAGGSMKAMSNMKVSGVTGNPIWLSAANRPIASSCASVASRVGRSEEHTSELQSLMRISYAVFCLKKKKERVTR